MAWWSVVVTQPNAERRALDHLAQQGFLCYAPRIKQTSVVAGKLVTRERWMFSRYVFVQIIDRWKSIFGTRGVSSMIMNGEQPAKLPDAEILQLKSRELGGFVQLRQLQDFYAGQKLRVAEGQFIGLDAIAEGTSASGRVDVLINLLGRQTRVKLAADSLELA